MRATLRTRKPVSRLTLSDLRSFPVWEFCIDEEGVEGQDETWIRPLARSTIPRKGWSLPVAANFTFKDGSNFKGFVVTTTASDDSDQPGAVLFFGGRQVCVPTKTEFNRNAAKKDLLKALAREAKAVFPIRFQLQVLVHGEMTLRSGVLR
jgi:hypothetical protein